LAQIPKNKRERQTKNNLPNQQGGVSESRGEESRCDVWGGKTSSTPGKLKKAGSLTIEGVLKKHLQLRRRKRLRVDRRPAKKLKFHDGGKNGSEAVANGDISCGS